MKTESNTELEKILYMPLPDGRADVWLRKNIEQVEVDTGEGTQTVWTADEVYFRTSLIEQEVEDNFDALFEAGGDGSQESEPEPQSEPDSDTGGAQTLAERVTELESIMVLVVEAEINAGLITEDDLPESNIRDTVKADIDGSLKKDFP